MGFKFRNGITTLDFDIIGIGTKGDKCELDDWVKTKIKLETRYDNVGETLESGDLIRIKKTLDDLVNGRITQVEELGFAEPDFEIVLHPGGRSKPWIEIKVDFIGKLGAAGVSGQSIKIKFDDVLRLRDYLAKRIAELGFVEGVNCCL
jgi:hypothetical protein